LYSYQLHPREELSISVSASSLQHDASFVIVTYGHGIKVWHGRDANSAERKMAESLAVHYRSIVGWKSTTVQMYDEGKEDASFWQLIDGDRRQISQLGKKVELQAAQKIVYDITSDPFIFLSKGSYKLNLQLQSKHMYLFEIPSICIFLWIGKSVSSSSRKQAYVHVLQYMLKLNVPSLTPIHTIHEGTETQFFKSLFLPSF